MTMLLTADEAAERLGHSAITLVEAADRHLGADRLRELLHGTGSLRGLTPRCRARAVAHRRIVTTVVAAGHAALLDDQIDGALSYFGFDDDRPAAA